MATLTAKLILTSQDTSTDVLNSTTTSTLTVANPVVNQARRSIATGSAQEIIASNSAFHMYM